MTPTEIVAGLRRAAVVCVEKNTDRWYSVDVCQADATYNAALQWVADDEKEDSAEHAAFFLLLVAEAHDAA